MLGDIAALAASLAILTVAGDQFVIGMGRSAGALRVRPTVVGAVIGGIGASLPELIVAGVAAGRGAPEIAVGSLVGSNIANVSLALAIAALVAPVRVDSRTVRREAPISAGAVVLFAVLLTGGLTRTEGSMLAGALIVALVVLLANASHGPAGDELGEEVTEFFDRPRRRAGPEIVRALAGLAAMVAGAELLVRSATGLAERWGLAEGLVGLTLVAVGTSAPVIAIAIQAARRGDHDLVVGNVLGSNLFIALAGGAIVAFIHGGQAATVGVVAAALMAGLALAAWGFMARRSRITRWEAFILILAYCAGLPFLTR